MDEFFGGVIVGIIVGVILLGLLLITIDPRQQGMIAVASGQYVCELEERADKTTRWVCEKVE